MKPNMLILNAINRAFDAVNNRTDPEEKNNAYKRLCSGSVRRSKVEGVRDQLSVQQMVMALTKLMNKIPIEDGRVCYRFEVPLQPPDNRNPRRPRESYKAFTPFATVAEIHRKGRVFAKNISYAALPGEGDEMVYKLHAPEIRPVQTNVVTFIMKDDELCEWFAGEYDYKVRGADAFSGKIDHGREKVVLGVDLEKELEQERYFRNNRKQPHHNKPVQNNQHQLREIHSATAGLVEAAFKEAEAKAAGPVALNVAQGVTELHTEEPAVAEVVAAAAV